MTDSSLVAFIRRYNARMNELICISGAPLITCAKALVAPLLCVQYICECTPLVRYPIHHSSFHSQILFDILLDKVMLQW